VGLHVLDQTEYPPAVAQAIASVRPGKPAQATPWWRFW
jgi:hypothetical protein